MAKTTLVIANGGTTVIKTPTLKNIVTISQGTHQVFTIGVQGVPGVDGVNVDKHYTHNQNVAAAQWDVNHNLNKFPSVQVVDSGGSIVIGDVKMIDSNNVTLIFSGAFSGKAYFN